MTLPNHKAAVFGGKCQCIAFLKQRASTHVPSPNLKDQETVLVRTLTVDQPGMRFCERCLMAHRVT
ncbi:hypothetical protein CSKR_101149 [Clonorchis sinensis]|uniref:Uncharacterized protein n=1 Tax=Clonorchis sinensis TaxID=79923 RepID=A0A3R7CLF7_CLOSI|nr:hypothetical protein CSKR_101149 [Clonorchis sinensis]